MKKPMFVMFVLLCGIVQKVAASGVGAVMYVDTEMPCLPDETLSGKIIISNKGDDDIKLLKREPLWSDMLVHTQLYLFLSISENEKEKKTDRFMTGWRMRQIIKENVEHDVQNPQSEYVVTLKKGESLEIAFNGRELNGLYSIGNQQVLFTAELYLSPDTWIPVEVHPPIVVACGITYTSVTPTEAGQKWDKDATKVYRVPIGTNEVLLVKEKSKYHRLADLQPDDVVAHANKTITITQKNGNVRTIPEADIPRVSTERKEEIRRNRQPETKN